jgi:hypothetical protein
VESDAELVKPEDYIKVIEFQPGTYNVVLFDASVIEIQSLQHLCETPSNVDMEVIYIPCYVKPGESISDKATIITGDQKRYIQEWLDSV